MNTPNIELPLSKSKEVLDHDKLNELQSRLEKFQTIDLEEECKVNSYCKFCALEKPKFKEICKNCTKLEFNTKVEYGIFASGWLTGSIISIFFFENAPVISIGLCLGSISNLFYKVF
jgi:hypothetical protein